MSAWYFIELKSSNLAGGTQIGLPLSLIDSDKSEAGALPLPVRNVLCHAKEKRFLNVNLTWVSNSLHRPIFFHYLKFHYLKSPGDLSQDTQHT